jgi:hypothetical protein
LVATIVSSGLVAPISSATASPYHETIITVAGPRFDWISRGFSRFFHHGNSDVYAEWVGRELLIEAEGGNTGDSPYLEGHSYSPARTRTGSRSRRATEGAPRAVASPSRT